MAEAFTSLGPHRLPVREYEKFEHITTEASVVENDAVLVDSQDAGIGQEVNVVEIFDITEPEDLQAALLVGEVTYPSISSVGPHRLPISIYSPSPHFPFEPVAEVAEAVDIQFVRGSQSVVAVEFTGYADFVIAQSALPDTVSEVATFQDASDAALARAGALVSTLGAMGVPRQRWVDFIHASVVQESANLIDVHDAAAIGQQVGFIGDFLTLIATRMRVQYFTMALKTVWQSLMGLRYRVEDLLVRQMNLH